MLEFFKYFMGGTLGMLIMTLLVWLGFCLGRLSAEREAMRERQNDYNK